MSTKTAYTVAASYFHWIVAAPMITSIGCVLKAQQSPKEEKGLWIFRHKSFGLLTGMLVAPRIGYRLYNAAKVCIYVCILCIYEYIMETNRNPQMSIHIDHCLYQLYESAPSVA